MSRRVKVGSALALAALLAPLVSLAPAASAGGSDKGLNDQDRKFLEDAAHGARFEVEAGNAAKESAGRDDVKAFGQRMVDDHSRQYDELKQLASSLGVEIPDAPDEEQQQIVKLQGELTGSCFDAAYIPLEYVDHELDVSDFKDEVEQGGNAEVRDFAARWMPILQSHRDQAEGILMGQQPGQQ